MPARVCTQSEDDAEHLALLRHLELGLLGGETCNQVRTQQTTLSKRNAGCMTQWPEGGRTVVSGRVRFILYSCRKKCSALVQMTVAARPGFTPEGELGESL